VAELIGGWILLRAIELRIAVFARGCPDEVVLAAARATLPTQ
jgi:hypothetical protein